MLRIAKAGKAVYTPRNEIEMTIKRVPWEAMGCFVFL